jgi:hypothetical protein
LRGFFGRRAVRVVVVVALVVVVVFFLFLLLNWYVAPAEPGASVRKDLILAVAQIVGGTALLSGLYFTWRTLQVNREGQITERFTRAIDQLGKIEDGQKLFEIRIGGIYALERIARESQEDYWPIMEILTAYVRQNATSRRKEGHQDTDGATGEETLSPPAPDPDIQAIMTVLRRRSRSYMHGEPEFLDMHATHLIGVNLSGALLSGALLYDTNFYIAYLSGADLSGANLALANFYRASLSGANLRGAELWRAGLTAADLSAADLSGANLKEAYLCGANLSGANLSGANLSSANFEAREFPDGIVLSAADISEANLSGADLSEATFTGANLSGAVLADAEGPRQ